MSDLATRYQILRDKIILTQKISSFHPKVTLLAVSKTQPTEAIAELYHLGQRDFGENYAQELLQKAETLAARGLHDIRWHFIGHLQTNKVKTVLAHLSAIHSVNSVRLAEEISKRALILNRRMDCLIEINMSKESSKSGVSLAELSSLREACSTLPGIRLQGLMCIPSPEDSSIQLRESFASLRHAGKGLPWLSMGMSEDFELAIAEGATHVRIGTALFGPRKNVLR